MNPRILVVDDEPQIRRFLRATLEVHGYEVGLAETGRAALGQLTTWHPDVLLLDLGLPEIDGLEVCRRVREWSDVPIIVLSVRDREDVVQALKLGANDFVTKPLDFPVVLARVQFGPVLDAQKSKADAFLRACRGAGIQAEIPDDIVKANWEKFVFLVGLSSATALARAPLGVVRSDPDLRWLFEQSMRETWRVGRARGVALADDYIEQRMSFADGLHADMKSSLLLDLENRGRLEAPWLCGAVVRMSEEEGLEAPVNRSVYAALKPYLNGQ